MRLRYGRSAGMGCAMILILLIISAAVGAIVWPYTLNSWLIFFGKEPTVVWWHGALLGFCPYVGQASVPAAVITWILMLFLA